MKLDAATLDVLADALVRELPEPAAQARGGTELEAAAVILLESPGLRHDPDRLERLFAKRLLPPIWGTLVYLSRRHQLANVPRLADRFRKRREAGDAVRPVLLRSARPLDEDNVREIRERLIERFHQPVALTVELDPSLLGGFLLQSGEWEYDATVAGRVKRLAQRLQE